LLALFLQGIVLGFPAAATPGPLQAYFLHQTMSIGWRKTLPSALAPLLSDGPIILIVLLILTQVPESFLRILRIGGGVFLLYLAVQAFLTLRKGTATINSSQDSSQRSLLKASVTNLLNPSPYIFWSLVAGPILLASWRQSAVHGASFLLGFYIMLIMGFASFIILFAVARHAASRLVHVFSIVAVLALAVFGLYQLWMGVTG